MYVCMCVCLCVCIHTHSLSHTIDTIRARAFRLNFERRQGRRKGLTLASLTVDLIIFASVTVDLIILASVTVDQLFVIIRRFLSDFFF